MRRLPLMLFAAAALAGCAADMGPPPQRTAKQEDTLRRALAGKVAERPVSCLPTYRQSNMEVVDDYTILFHDGSSRVYLQSPAGGCHPLGSGSYTLVTNIHNPSGTLCSGDISRVVDLSGSRMTVGSCAMSDFVPYVTPGRG